MLAELLRLLFGGRPASPASVTPPKPTPPAPAPAPPAVPAAVAPAAPPSLPAPATPAPSSPAGPQDPGTPTEAPRAPDVLPADPAWLAIGRGFLGVKEIPGQASNAVILGWAKSIGGWVASYFTNDDIAWCALFANICLLKAGLKGTGQSLRARDFETWGQPLPGPALGCVLTFKREGGGHVGFYLGQRADGTLRVLGGNQSNAVSATWIAKDRLTAYRWPAGVESPRIAPILLASNGEAVSTNES